MLGFKELFNKSVDLIKQVQDQVQQHQAKATQSPSSAAPTMGRDYPGRHLIARQEQSWEQIAANGTKLVTVVSADDNKVKCVAGRCEAELAAWGRLQQELETLAVVGDAVDTLRAEMEALCGQLQSLDTALEQHMEAREEKEMWRWKADLEKDTQKFAQSREKEVRMLEQSLKAEMTKRTKARAAAAAQAASRAQAEKRAAAAATAAGQQAASSTDKGEADVQAQAVINQETESNEKQKEQVQEQEQAAARQEEAKEEIAEKKEAETKQEVDKAQVAESKVEQGKEDEAQTGAEAAGDEQEEGKAVQGTPDGESEASQETAQ